MSVRLAPQQKAWTLWLIIFNQLEHRSLTTVSLKSIRVPNRDGIRCASLRGPLKSVREVREDNDAMGDQEMSQVVNVLVWHFCVNWLNEIDEGSEDEFAPEMMASDGLQAFSFLSIFVFSADSSSIKHSNKPSGVRSNKFFLKTTWSQTTDDVNSSNIT